MKKVYFLNPHLADFTGEPILYRIFKKRPLKKYDYLNKTLINYNLDEKVLILIDPCLSSLIPISIFRLLPFWLRILIARLEVNIWALINNKYKYRIYDLKDINESFVIFAFCFKTYHNGLNSYHHLLKANSIILHLSHYFVRTSEIRDFINKCSDKIILAFDNNLKENVLFKKLVKYKSYRTIILPFLCRDIFNYPNNKWENRKNHIISTGTFHPIDLINKNNIYLLFRQSFPKKTFHNFRRELFLNKDQLKQLKWRILCSPYKENNSYSNLGKIFSKILGNVGLQENYFKLNIADEYKSSKFSYIDPETSGSLSIGLIESAACGCIPLIPSSYVEGLPLKSGIDYVEIEKFTGNVKEYIEQIYNATRKDLKLNPLKISTKYRSFFSTDSLVNYSTKVFKYL